jgi:hypothetical protein
MCRHPSHPRGTNSSPPADPVSPPADVGECVKRLLYGFTTYDRAVDVVSAFEMAFTTSLTGVPATVRHFERFPRVPDASGNTLTPDFSVWFDDGAGLVGEIARIALNDNSVESLCTQIAKYDALAQLPGPDGIVEVDYVDVLLLVPQSVGVAAVRRIVVERYADPAHGYKPSVPPCVVQFAFDEDRYIFQRLLDPRNGVLREGERPEGLGRWFEENGDFKTRPSRFSDIKAERAFMNDPVDPLYLATHLWAKTFPTGAGDSRRPVRMELTAAALAAELRDNYGGVRSTDVERALDLLRIAKLAERTTDGWVVAWEELRVTGEHDLAQALATRSCRPPGRSALAKLEAAERAAETTPPPPETLF